MDINALALKGFNTTKALELVGGSEEIYQKVINTYYNTIELKIADIKKAKETGDIKNYTVLVHALKSSSRQIGADELGENAYHLELSGKAEDIAEIEAKTDALIEEYRTVGKLLEEFVTEKAVKESVEKKGISTALVKAKLLKLKQCAKKFDSDGISKIVEEFSEYSFNQELAAVFKDIENASMNYKYNEVESNAEKMLSML